MAIWVGIPRDEGCLEGLRDFVNFFRNDIPIGTVKKKVRAPDKRVDYYFGRQLGAQNPWTATLRTIHPRWIDLAFAGTENLARDPAGKKTWVHLCFAICAREN